MSRRFDLPDIIPVFPLPGALLLPRARLPLHIFEPRYLAMLDDALKTDTRLIGMIQPDKMAEKDGGTGLHRIGCAGRVTQFSETEDGRYMVTLFGLSRFRILEEIDGFSPYRRCKVNWDGFERDKAGTEHDAGFDRDAFLATLDRFFHLRGLDADWGSLKDADDELLVNSLSMLLDLAPEDKQALLEAPSLSTRRETLVTLIEFALRGGGTEDKLQ
ncbi:LON peptidase substrate-binding domain-containing protein [Citreicella sp. C3M06]|uniref:LON peptidase substrate-binding domain-containing protein n=1 Tax=Citreicella sp. C3M06 TaxID=2841564 RepID=UPI001C086C11|nr:LON peptidase substrate-binding domain-containing protein [Citreicella sp. C3M06]MBU2960967.1 LON peptidase substrate-binding domain-containing protein [Citreicella sp. C3M06]